MNKITSFCIDHDILEKGMYISRIDKDIITYDLRMVKPNSSTYLNNAGLHTFEHLFATYVRNTKYSDDIIYVGPMGCRTGFYFLTRDTISQEDSIHLIQETMAFIANFEEDIPGASESKECGNYLDHNLEEAKAYAKDYAEVLKNYQIEQLNYPTH
ncbi:MAG: S-ribosylhomocysteine lyase [Erysipelotrichia bacterium]|nr:S-ribosylhomocysteine lyase [Erysipelotrichia bacterium]NCC54812.1 S-ribosylhomocysteine lyase [Erysipelotrichia bacterium]